MTEKTTTGRLVAAGGGLLLIISLFLSWYGVNIGGVAGQFAAAVDTSANGWQSLDLGDIVFFLVGLCAIAPAAFDIFDLEIELPFDIAFVALVGGAVSVAWIILRIIDKPGPDIPDVAGVDVGIGLKIGIFLALIGAALVVFGGFLQKQEEEEGVAYAQAAPGAPAQAPPPAAPPAAAPPAAAPPATPPPAAAPPAGAPPAQAPPAPQPPAPEQPQAPQQPPQPPPA